MSGDGKRGGAQASVLAPILDSTKNATLIRRTGFAEVAITGDQLSVAIRALLDFATWSVKLPLGHAAVMTGRHVGPPTEAFVSISGSSEQFPTNRVVR
jgi:hypothetical protein